ncbi:MAG: glycogen synthase GlgA [Candidatus Omnitrophota bacterium]
MSKKLSIAFFWHMHQPMYKDLVTGRYHLPWVRLHSTYSYLDMAAILDEFPGVKSTFNFTPALIWQLLDIARDEPADDIYLSLSEKDAACLSREDKCFLLKNFFSCDLTNAITPFKKYRELFSRRGDDLRTEELVKRSKDFSAGDFRDLQVFFNLAWCGFTLKDKDTLVKALVHKASNYTEDDKNALLKRQKEVVASIIPAYKRLQDEGRIEITTSPFYHPILPLLCGNKSSEEIGFLEDAKKQVTKAVSLYEEVFGRKPLGMWPPEGSVSQEIIPVLADAGIKWIATDEGILLESFRGKGIPREDLVYKAFTAEESGKRIDMVFRDINISNAISFRYANMPAKKASGELFKDIRGIRKAMESREGEHIAAIILDGENPWPYYAHGGREFLSETYRHLSSDREVETVTIGEYLSSRAERKKIDKLFSGSWIDRSFSKWIGSPQKNKAWEYLKKARKALAGEAHPSREVLEELYIAEGSDWFWWYDDFGSELNFVFDELFRLHLANIYTFMGREVPHYLREPIHAGPVAQKVPEVRVRSEMARSLKILLVSSEVIPFAKTGGLADVTGNLPRALGSFGCDARSIMPLYRCVANGRFKLTKEKAHIKKPLPGSVFGFDLYANRTDGVTTYFVRNKKYFARDGLYGTPQGDYPDNGLRFGFFAKAVLDAIKAVDFKPDIIHCNDWQSALIPFYLKFMLTDDSFYRGIKVLFTIHNMSYQGIFSEKIMDKIGIPGNFFNMNDLEFYGKLNFMKSGILYSDAISTVSHRYAEEIMTPEYGSSLDGLLRAKKEVFYGIPNGVDYSVWSPENDKHIKVNYDAESIEKKSECKKDLLEYARLAVSSEAPLVGCVTRLAWQKGMDLVANIMDRITKLGIGVVVLGKGSREYNRLFLSLAKKYPRNVYVCNDFNDELAHKIEAGCDMFLMPSRYEPCGLNQMYSLKYGTIPIVRATGGLDDVIVDIDEDRKNGNGFKFGPATEEALLGAIKRAVRSYGDKEAWKTLMKRAMGCDFSWAHSAEQYLRLYGKIMGGD